MLRLTGIKLFILAVLLNGCTKFALLSSGSSLAISNNTYAKVYSGIDLATTLTTEKDIKTHTYHYLTKAKELKELVINTNKIETVKTIPVEESIIYPPDENLLLASMWTFKEDKINNNRIELYMINQTGYKLQWEE
tara:strand:+ start:86 stop:493 length:408 start_codon:yes stop_codon:yes gene_type:complete